MYLHMKETPSSFWTLTRLSRRSLISFFSLFARSFSFDGNSVTSNAFSCIVTNCLSSASLSILCSVIIYSHINISKRVIGIVFLMP